MYLYVRYVNLYAVNSISLCKVIHCSLITFYYDSLALFSAVSPVFLGNADLEVCRYISADRYSADIHNSLQTQIGYGYLLDKMAIFSEQLLCNKLMQLNT